MDLSKFRERDRLLAGCATAMICVITLVGLCLTSDAAAFDFPFAITIADLNNDGLPDITVAVTNITGAPPHPGFVSVILQDSLRPGTFLPGEHYSAGTDPLAIAAGDLNGDGCLDLAVADSSSGKVSILMQDPSNPGEFLPQVRISVGGSPSGIEIADIDGDGRADIAVATVATLKILYQDTSGPPGYFLPPVTIPTGHGSWAVAIGDVNGDGVPDLVSVSGVVSVMLQDTDQRGTFLPASDFHADLQPTAIKIGDLNGDGLPDLVVANLGSPTAEASAYVSILLQNPANPGSFLRRANYKAGARTSDIAIGDLNKDGVPDLVAANNGRFNNTGSVSVLLQKPPRKGTELAFSRKNYAGKTGPSSIAIGDLNDDGYPDLAVADGKGATVLFQKPGLPGRFSLPVQVGE